MRRAREGQRGCNTAVANSFHSTVITLGIQSECGILQHSRAENDSGNDVAYNARQFQFVEDIRNLQASVRINSDAKNPNSIGIGSISKIILVPFETREPRRPARQEKA